MLVPKPRVGGQRVKSSSQRAGQEGRGLSGGGGLLRQTPGAGEETPCQQRDKSNEVDTRSGVMLSRNNQMQECVCVCVCACVCVRAHALVCVRERESVRVLPEAGVLCPGNQPAWLCPALRRLRPASTLVSHLAAARLCLLRGLTRHCGPVS